MSGAKMKGYVGAFVIGGIIGLLCQLFMEFYMSLGMSLPMGATLSIFTLAIAGSVLGATGISRKLEALGGMGFAIPLSGLTSAVTGSIVGGRASGLSSKKALQSSFYHIVFKLFSVGISFSALLAVIKYFMG